MSCGSFVMVLVVMVVAHGSHGYGYGYDDGAQIFYLFFARLIYNKHF